MLTSKEYKTSTVEDILKKYKENLADKELTDRQAYKSSQLNKKIVTRFNSKQLKYILGK